MNYIGMREDIDALFREAARVVHPSFVHPELHLVRPHPPRAPRLPGLSKNERRRRIDAALRARRLAVRATDVSAAYAATFTAAQAARRGPR